MASSVRFGVLAAFLMTSIGGAATASQEETNQQKREANLAFAIKVIQNEIRRVAADRMMLRVDALVRHADAPEEKRKQLELVVKGILSSRMNSLQAKDIERILNRRPAIIESPFLLNGREQKTPHVIGDIPDKPGLVFVGISNHAAWVHIRDAFGQSGTSIRPGMTQLLKEPRWIARKHRILSAAERTQLRKADQKRLARACATMLLGYLDGILELSDEQHAKARTYLLREFSNRPDQLNEYDLAQPTIKPLSKDNPEFEAILTPHQLRRWKDYQFRLKHQLR